MIVEPELIAPDELLFIAWETTPKTREVVNWVAKYAESVPLASVVPNKLKAERTLNTIKIYDMCFNTVE